MHRNCSICGKGYEAHRSTSRYCSDACRQRAHRQRIRDRRSGAKAPQQSQREQLAHRLGVAASPLVAQGVMYLLDRAANIALREMVDAGINATAVGSVERSYATFRAQVERELDVGGGRHRAG